jgi:hypothetical protein
MFAHGAKFDDKFKDGKTPIEVAREFYPSETLLRRLRDMFFWRQCVIHAFLLAWACHQIAERQFELFRLRAFHVCVGLERRQLPALVTCEILARAFAVAFHRVWAIVTTVKHFREPRAQTHASVIEKLACSVGLFVNGYSNTRCCLCNK